MLDACNASDVKPDRRACAAQITTEQILRESKELQEVDFKPPKQKISSPAELAEYRLRKRKEFEDKVRRVRWNQAVWVKVYDFISYMAHACADSTAHANMCALLTVCSMGGVPERLQAVSLCLGASTRSKLRKCLTVAEIC